MNNLYKKSIKIALCLIGSMLILNWCTKERLEETKDRISQSRENKENLNTILINTLENKYPESSIEIVDNLDNNKYKVIDNKTGVEFEVASKVVTYHQVTFSDNYLSSYMNFDAIENILNNYGYTYNINFEDNIYKIEINTGNIESENEVVNLSSLVLDLKNCIYNNIPFEVNLNNVEDTVIGYSLNDISIAVELKGTNKLIKDNYNDNSEFYYYNTILNWSTKDYMYTDYYNDIKIRLVYNHNKYKIWQSLDKENCNNLLGSDSVEYEDSVIRIMNFINNNYGAYFIKEMNLKDKISTTEKVFEIVLDNGDIHNIVVERQSNRDYYYKNVKELDK